jgi:hypothetical protein
MRNLRAPDPVRSIQKASAYGAREEAGRRSVAKGLWTSAMQTPAVELEKWHEKKNEPHYLPGHESHLLQCGGMLTPVAVWWKCFWCISEVKWS